MRTRARGGAKKKLLRSLCQQEKTNHSSTGVTFGGSNSAQTGNLEKGGRKYPERGKGKSQFHGRRWGKRKQETDVRKEENGGRYRQDQGFEGLGKKKAGRKWMRVDSQGDNVATKLLEKAAWSRKERTETSRAGGLATDKTLYIELKLMMGVAKVGDFHNS